MWLQVKILLFIKFLLHACIHTQTYFKTIGRMNCSHFKKADSQHDTYILLVYHIPKIQLLLCSLFKICFQVVCHLICCLIFEVMYLWTKVWIGVEAAAAAVAEHAYQVLIWCQTKHFVPYFTQDSNDTPHFLYDKTKLLRSHITYSGSHSHRTEIWLCALWWQSWISQ